MWNLPRPGIELVSSLLAGRFSTTEPLGKPVTESLMKKSWLCFIQELDPLFSLPAQLRLLSSLVFNSSQELGSRGHFSISFWKNVLQGTSSNSQGTRLSMNAGVRRLFSPLADTTWPSFTSASERGAPPVGGKDRASLCARSFRVALLRLQSSDLLLAKGETGNRRAGV